MQRRKNRRRITENLRALLGLFIRWQKCMGLTMSDQKKEAAGRMEEQSSQINEESKRIE